MTTTINAPAFTITVSCGAVSVPCHIYAEAITINMNVSPAYLPPKPTAAPTGVVIEKVLLTQKVMPTPTIVNGRPT